MRRREFLTLAGAVGLAGGGRAASNLASDPQRPQYHLLPAANWMNDPNGPIFWQGHYHMFYQYNPNGAYWGDMHWGHAVSPDMVRWKHLPVALSPTPGGPDKDGVFSGCTVIDHGNVTAVYTAVQPETQSIATSSGDLSTWKKFAGNPVIATPPPGLEVAGFRDPCVWREGSSWLMAVGSGFRGKGGAVLLYESKDLRNWEYLSPLITGHKREGESAKDPVDSGEMWECPDFFELGGKHVLLISSERVVRFLMGAYEERRFRPDVLGTVDFGSYYAARTMANTGDRRILWGWIGEGRSAAAQRAAGWSGVMSLPRELKTFGSQLQMRPAEEVTSLRGRKLGPDASGACVEILAEIDPGDASRVGLKLRAAADGSEQTLLYFDREQRRLIVDRSRSSTSPGVERGPQSGPFNLGRQEMLRLHVFLDGSVVEIFANDRACLTARIYPADARSTGLGLYAPAGNPRLVSLSAWEMRPISPDRLTS
jgi:beta-fructofuranosidase